MTQVGDMAEEARLALPGREPPTVVRRTEDRDPLARVLSLGDRAARVGAAIGLAIALITHGTASAKAVMSLVDMRKTVQAMRASLHDFFWTNYDIDLTPPDKPKPPPPPEPPAPEAAPVAPAPKTFAPPPKDDPYEPPPAAAKAARILDAPKKADDDIKDFTGFVNGDGDAPGYGQVAAAGTGTAPTWSPHASATGTPGGTGTAKGPPPPPPPPVEDRSRPAGLVGGTAWSCPFPPEADSDQIDQAAAVIVVTVRPDGSPLAVQIVSDPGHGFGRAARTCALGRRYTPGFDRSGAPAQTTTPPITVRFTR